MHKISPFAILIAIFSLLFAAGFWFLVIPQISATRSEQASLQALLSKPNAVAVKDASAASRDATASQAAILVPLADEQYDLTIQLEALMKNLGLPISTLSVQAAPATDTAGGPVAARTAAPGVKLVDINVSTSGSYADVQRLVQGMVGLDRYIAVDQVNLAAASAADPKSGDDTVTAQITAFAFYLPAP